MTNQTETLAGNVERVTFHNEENGFCVLKIKCKGHKDLITVVGNISTVNPGEFIEANGFWIHDRNHGRQFKASFLKASAPTSLEGIEKYLGSGMIKGIGPIYAKRLVKKFEEKVFDVIENNPELLSEIYGIGKRRLEIITRGWSDQRIIRDIMLFLHSHGISTSRAVRIYKTYGTNAIEVVSQNPYRLAQDIKGIGFISADKIALNVGIARDSILRARAGIAFTLMNGMDEGNCGLFKDQLITSCQILLEISSELVEEALSLEREEVNVVSQMLDDKLCIFLSGLFHAEKAIASKLIKMSNYPTPWPAIDSDQAVKWLEDKINITLSPSQKEAITTALTSNLLIITGGPGVGKTTLVNSILKVLSAKSIRILLAAPTGRAAKRLSESTGMQAKTIHRLLETNPATGSFVKNEKNMLECDLLVVDEASMIDIPLMHNLLKALPETSSLLVVGDIDQLPSVGPGQLLADLINSETVKVVKLQEIFRQAASSKIITTAHAINQGLMPELKNEEGADFYFVDADTPEQCLDKIIKIIKERIPAKFGLSPFLDVQVLCPMGRGIVGTNNLNVSIQNALNPPNSNSITKYGYTYSVNDKVMQIENNYDKDVYNGDIGIIKSISSEEFEVVISFDDKDVVYEFSELDEIVLAYATTIHKSQGSEYPAVIVPISMQHYIMLKRNLIYTGITRGKKLVILVGTRKSLWVAVKNHSSHQRISSLKLRMKELSILTQQPNLSTESVDRPLY